MDELRSMIRELLAEELARQGNNHRKPRDSAPREESVTLRNDADLNQFAKRMIRLAQNPSSRDDIEKGRLVFRLSGGAPATRAAATAVTLEPGLVTERQVQNLPSDVTAVRIGKSTRLTPLAADALRQAGIKIERSKS